MSFSSDNLRTAYHLLARTSHRGKKREIAKDLVRVLGRKGNKKVEIVLELFDELDSSSLIAKLLAFVGKTEEFSSLHP